MDDRDNNLTLILNLLTSSSGKQDAMNLRLSQVAEDVAVLRSSKENLEKSVDNLLAVVRDGPNSLTSRMDGYEQRLNVIEKEKVTDDNDKKAHNSWLKSSVVSIFTAVAVVVWEAYKTLVLHK